ncbi:MAG: hypothetical protein RL415_468, partial [Actinomycetota bacterium]
ELPDDPRHFVAVNIDNRIYNFDLASHLTPPFSLFANSYSFISYL